jgi:hypothetical protein
MAAGPRNQLALVPTANLGSYSLRRHLDAERDLGSDRAEATMCEPGPWHHVKLPPAYTTSTTCSLSLAAA